MTTFKLKTGFGTSELPPGVPEILIGFRVLINRAALLGTQFYALHNHLETTNEMTLMLLKYELSSPQGIGAQIKPILEDIIDFGISEDLAENDYIADVAKYYHIFKNIAKLSTKEKYLAIIQLASDPNLEFITDDLTLWQIIEDEIYDLDTFSTSPYNFSQPSNSPSNQSNQSNQSSPLSTPLNSPSNQSNQSSPSSNKSTPSSNKSTPLISPSNQSNQSSPSSNKSTPLNSPSNQSNQSSPSSNQSTPLNSPSKQSKQSSLLSTPSSRLEELCDCYECKDIRFWSSLWPKNLKHHQIMAMTLKNLFK